MAIATSTALLVGTGLTVGAGLISANADRQSAEDAASSLQNNRDNSQAFIERSISQAREDVFKLFPQAQETRRQGAQAGLDIFSQSIPAQSQLFQQGNIAAQNQLIQGLPQFQNAILGRPTNLNLQATSLQAPTGIAGLQLPTQPVATQLPLATSAPSSDPNRTPGNRRI